MKLRSTSLQEAKGAIDPSGTEYEEICFSKLQECRVPDDRVSGEAT